MRLPAIVLSFGASLAAFGAPVNDVCPVSGKPIPADAATLEYEGWTVGFCCAMCPAKWDDMRTANKLEFLENHVKPGPINAMCPIGKEPVVMDVPVFLYEGHAIGTCCPGCEKEFLALPEAERQAFIKKCLDAPVVNTVCPVGGDPVDASSATVVFLGSRIAFCCDGCESKWKIMTSQQRLQTLAKARGDKPAE